MEADFNSVNKIIYGNRMMNNVRKYGYMPEEIYSEKGKMADDGSLAKVLFYDLARQSRTLSAIASIGAANCYDSITHAISSMVFQAFGVPIEAIDSMLTAIQNMKYFLRTAYGDSKEFAGSSIEIKFQGLCQGNGAAPAGWALISITIIPAHTCKGHGGYFVCPISKLTAKLAAIIFVDDTDLLHIRMDKNESASEAHSALQESIISWGQLLDILYYSTKNVLGTNNVRIFICQWYSKTILPAQKLSCTGVIAISGINLHPATYDGWNVPLGVFI